MYLNIFNVLDVHNNLNFEKIACTKPFKNCQYHVLLIRCVQILIKTTLSL